MGHGDRPGGMVLLGVFDRGIRQAAAPVTVLHRPAPQAGQVVQQLGPGVPRMRRARGVKARPELGVIVSKVGGSQFILG
ncbi:hypothetical protein D3C86_2153640 [compost metagenome]